MSCDIGDVTAHSPILPLLYPRHSSLYNPSFAFPTSQALHLIHLASPHVGNLLVDAPLYSDNPAVLYRMNNAVWMVLDKPFHSVMKVKEMDVNEEVIIL